MIEPGKLITLYGNLSQKERGQLADLLDQLSGTNTFKVLEDFLGELFIPFLDTFQDETVTIPNLVKIIKRIEYLRIYNDSEKFGIEYLCKKYKKKPNIINTIISNVHEELNTQDGDTHDININREAKNDL